MKNPVLLNGHTLETKAALRPSSMSLTLLETPPSSASMVLMDDSSTVTIGDWVRVFSPQGDAGVFVIKSVETDYTAGNKRTASIQHAYSLLDNILLVGETNPGGTDDKGDPVACTPAAAIRAALAAQTETVWQLGTCEFTTKQQFQFNDQSIKSCIDTVLKTLNNYQLQLDCSSLPFTINIVSKPVEIACEMRLNRNVSTIRMTVDKSDMINRLYPIGNNNLRLSGNGYIEDADSISAYGLVSKCQTDQGIETESQLRAWGRTILNRYKDPSVIVTVSGRELSETTGDPFDRLTVGTMCRIPLPDFGTSVTDRITQLVWQDVIGQPEAVTVTLSNTRQTYANLAAKVSSIAASTSSSEGGGGGGGGGASNRNNGEIDNLIYDEDTGLFSRVEQTRNYIRATIAGIADVDISTVSQFYMDSDEIHALIYESDGSPIAGMESTLKTVAGDVESVMTIYDDLVDIINNLKVGGTLSAKCTISTDSWVDCKNLKVDGNVLSKQSVSLCTNPDWTGGSYETDTASKIKGAKWSTTEDGYIITDFDNITVVTSITFPDFDFNKSKLSLACLGTWSD